MAITVSKEWRDLISSQFRYPGHVRVMLYIMSTVSKLDIEASATNVFNLTDIDSTLDSFDSTYETVATFEGTWKADGSMYLPSTNVEENSKLPTWSQEPGQPMQLTYVFAETTSFVGITVSWDNTFNTWPTKVVVKGYDSTDTLQYEYPVDTIVSAFGLMDTPMDDVKKVVIEVQEWSDPNLRVRISEIYFGAIVELTNKQVMSTSESSKIDLMSAQLPTDIHKYTVKNQIYRVLPALESYAIASSTLPLTDVSRIFSQSPATEAIATVETSYWKADGTMYLPSAIPEENLDMPWIAEFPGEPAVITITYDSPVQLNQINITWDNINNAWPSSARVEGYNSYNEVMFVKQCGGDSVQSHITDIYSTVKVVKIYIDSWNNSGQRARINQYEALLVYGNNNIPSEVNNLFDPTLIIGYSKYLSQRQKVIVEYGLEDYDGSIIWTPRLTRFLSQWSIPSDAIQVDFESSTRLSFLTNTYKRGKFYARGVSFYDLALDILQKSNIIKDTSDPEPWMLPESLKQYTTVAPLPMGAENSLLQLIAGATAHYLDTDPETGYVRLVHSLDDTRYTIDGGSQLQTPSVSIDAELRSITVNLYSYTVDTEEVELYNDTLKLSGTVSLFITYKDNTIATECVAEVTGASVVSAEYFGYSAEIKIQAPAVLSNVSIKITGKKVSSSSVAIETYRNNLVKSGRDIVIDNKLVTNNETLRTVASAALDYYTRRVTVSTSYLGYPDIRAGDRIALYSQYMNENGHISESSFEFNGGFSGNIKVLMEV